MEKIIDKQKLISFFDSEADTWDQFRPQKESRLRLLIEYAGITKNMTVLDVGCATGMCARLCIEKDISLYHGIDISENMIEKAKQSIINPKVIFQCCDIEKACFHRKYDKVLAFSVLPHIENIDLFFENMYNLLEDDGSICVAHYKCSKRNSSSRVWDMDEKRILESIQKIYHLDNLIYDEEKLVIQASKIKKENI